MKEFRIYRPNKNGNGFASAWQLSYKEQNKYDKYQMFLVVAPQVGLDDNENAKFDWKDKSITVKLGENDIGEILAVLDRRKESVGFKGTLFHQSPNGGNKVIELKNAEKGDGYYFKVSQQTVDKEKIGPYSHIISGADAAILSQLLKYAIGLIYGWN